MKDLTYKEFMEAPPKVKFLYVAGLSNQPVGISVLESAMKDHPEYFPEEIERRKKWDAIPEGVHDKYWKERSDIRQQVYKEMPECIDDPNKHSEWSKKWDECRKVETPLVKAIHEKYYSQYGIEWDGNYF